MVKTRIHYSQTIRTIQNALPLIAINLQKTKYWPKTTRTLKQKKKLLRGCKKKLNTTIPTK